MIRSAAPFDLINSYSSHEVRKLADVFKLLSDPTRLKIILLLTENEEMHVNALCGELGQSQPAVSHHLGLLRGGKVIALRRDGKFNHYRVAGDQVCEQIAAFLNLVFDGVETCPDQRAALPARSRDAVVSPAAAGPA